MIESLKDINQLELSKIIGKDKATINRIFNSKQLCSKTLAYCIVKAINSEAEINDYFDLERE